MKVYVVLAEWMSDYDVTGNTAILAVRKNKEDAIKVLKQERNTLLSDSWSWKSQENGIKEDTDESFFIDDSDNTIRYDSLRIIEQELK